MKNELARWLGLVCIFMPVMGARAQATLVADTHVSSAQPTVNAGTLSNLNVGGGYTALVQFDLSMLPPGTTAAQVTRAMLRVYCNRADTPGVVAALPVNSAWGEYVVTYATLPTLGAAVQTAQVGAADSFVTFDVTATVQGWVAGTAANNGLALTAGTAVVQFDSKENDETGHAPELEIVLAAGSGAGTQGAVGPQGPAGPQGLTGAQGVAGLQGPVGFTGATGAAGVQGVQGPAGSAGIDGVTGATGSAGAPGPAGPTGAVGPQGLAGPIGLPGLVYQGTYASTSNYALGDVVVFAGASYASLVASNHGNTPGLSPAYWGTLTAQGPQGVQGFAGATGAAGPQGLPGSVGPPGERGDQGLQGVAGQAGAQGLTGASGAEGLQGPMGPQGVAGPVGMTFRGAYASTANYALADGVQYQGAGYVSLAASNHGNTPDQSPQFWALFATGTPGVAGIDGAIGPAGATGSVGPQGLVGAAGAVGATGPQGPAAVNYLGNYSSVASYGVADAVSYGGSTYVALQGNNHGNTPDQSPVYWAVLAAHGDAGVAGPAGPQGVVGATGADGAPGMVGPQGPPVNFAGSWLISRSYAVGDGVSYSGASYIAVAANVGQQPDVSSASWGVLSARGLQGPAGMQGVTGSTGAPGDRGNTGAQGAAGQAGAQGLPGVQGEQGIAGPVGAQGQVGPVGMTFRGAYDSAGNYAPGDGVLWLGAGWVSLVAGNHGNTPDQSPQAWAMFTAAGAAGAPGSAGAQGAQGVPGVQGPAGSVGLAGAMGPAGATGAIGPAGAQGTKGDAGVQGAVGAQGLTGPAGAQGDKGAAGAQGLAGQAGAQGVAGVAGATGPQGSAGAQGIPGAQGPTGAAGVAGAVGMNFRGAWTQATHYVANDAVTFGGSTYLAETASMNQQPDAAIGGWTVIAQEGGAGPTGAAGTAATVAVGTVTTLAPGSQASVTNSGAPGAATFNFGIPRGADGASGSTGSGSVTGGGFAATYHAVNSSAFFYALNAPTSALTETSAILTWVPMGCTAVRLDVFSQQSSSTLLVTLRSGTPGAMADTALSCAPASGGSCSVTGTVSVTAGSFLDLNMTHASGDLAGVWTKLECD